MLDTEKQKYETCRAFTRKKEGGYVDNPEDNGGATNKGVTIATLAAWRKKPVTKDDVRHLTDDEADAIYKARYYDPAHCDSLPTPLAVMVFDAAINSGPSRAVEWLQGAVGAKVDGDFGPATASALKIAEVSPAVQKLVIEKMAQARLTFMKSLHDWKTFGHGWENRVNEIKAYALSLV